MDKGKVGRWDWLPAAMPGVARRVRELRAEFGDAHVNECWKRGVMLLEPGWFFAREGAIAVGVPWRPEDMTTTPVAGVPAFPGQWLVVMREPEVAHGTH